MGTVLSVTLKRRRSWSMHEMVIKLAHPMIECRERNAGKASSTPPRVQQAQLWKLDCRETGHCRNAQAIITRLQLNKLAA